jgi:hypothetical protein
VNHRLARWLAFAALAATAALLHAAGWASLRSWAPRSYGDELVPVLLALLVAGQGARLLVRPAARPLVVVLLSLTCGLVATPIATCLGTLWALAYRRLLWSRAPASVGLAFPIATLVGVVAAADAAHFPDFAASNPWTGALASVFIFVWFFRALVVWTEVRQGAPRAGRVDILAYFLFAPFTLIPPYMLALPRLSLVTAGLATEDASVERSGLRWLLYGLGLQAATAGLARLGLDFHQTVEPALRAGHWTAFPLLVANVPLLGVLDAVGRGAVLVGLTRCFGAPMGPAFHAPLLARGIADWWRRYNTHFRDLLVDLFWYPVVLRLRRRPVLAGYLGCAAVFVAGSAPLHWPKQAALTGSPFSFSWGTAAESVALTVLVGTALALERRRSRRPPAPPPGAARVWGHRVATWVLVCATMVGVGHFGDYLVRIRPWEEVAASTDPADLPRLRRLVAEKPRAAERRRALARVLVLAGDLGGAAHQRRLADTFEAHTHP